MKKILSLMLSLVFILSLTFHISSADDNKMNFRDVKTKHWFYDSVKFVYERGLMNGLSETEFGPNGNLSRAMFITILGRMAEADTSMKDSFPDTKKNTWYSPYVGWAVNAGVVKGFEDGTFRPDDPLSREQMAAAISRYITAMSINMPRESYVPFRFADEKKIASWAKEDVKVLRTSGIVKGDSNTCYNPKSNITRAETATIILNLLEAEEKAWQGYLPRTEDDFTIYGANYLYALGTGFAGGMGVSLEKDEEYPYLNVFPDKKSSDYSNCPENTAGINVSIAKETILSEKPVVKFCFEFEGAECPNILPGIYYVNPCSNDWSMAFFHSYEKKDFIFEKSGTESGYLTAYADLSEIISSSSASVRDDLINVLMEIDTSLLSSGARFKLRYIAFFKDTETMKNTDVTEVYSDYLKSYFLYSGIEYRKIDEESKKTYDNLLLNRIDEIRNSPSEVKASDAKPGKRVYYISSINGDDANDGLSPEKPKKTPNSLFRKWSSVYDYISYLRPGDIVLFERGSEFYATQPAEGSSYFALLAVEGVSYGAYGTGPKPVFRCALDLREENNVGTWKKTEFENIYVLDSSSVGDGLLGTNPGGDVGNIVFNNGEAIGIRVIPDLENGYQDCSVSPFGKEITAFDYGFLSPDGKEYYHTGGTLCENPGTALHHNYEYLHDRYEGKLYLYMDKGNPAEVFDDIKIARLGFVVHAADNIVIDNLCVENCSRHGISADSNVTVKNCEIAYCAGGLDSAESGIEIFGDAKNVLMKNNYCHDIGDGPLSIQSTADGYEESTMKNCEVCNNVVVACGNGVEIWNKFGVLDENGIGKHKIIDFRVHDNIMAYIGYGICHRQEAGDNRNGCVICTSAMEGENCICADNIMMYSIGEYGINYYSSDNQGRGWSLENNVYINNPDLIHFDGRDNPDSYYQVTLAFYGLGRKLEMNERTVRFFASMGIEPNGRYLTVEDEGAAEGLHYFMTGGKLLEISESNKQK